MPALVQYATSAFTGDVSSLPRVPMTLPVTDYVRRFSAASLAGAVGSSVSSWTDLAGSGTSLTPLTTAPTLQQQNGMRCVRFDGVANMLTQTLALAQPHSVVILGRYVTTALPSGGVATLTGSTNTAGAQRATVYIDTNFRASAGGTALQSGIAANTTAHVFQATFQGTGSVLRVDGTEVSGNDGAEARSLFTLGGVSGSQWWGNVDVWEALVFSRAITSGERASLQTALAALLS